MRYISDAHNLSWGNRIIIVRMNHNIISFGIVKSVISMESGQTMICTDHGWWLYYEDTDSHLLFEEDNIIIQDNKEGYHIFLIDSWQDILDSIPIFIVIQYPEFLKKIYSVVANQEV